jgi:drug/metabolite transporter (DMT)-like permease
MINYKKNNFIFLQIIFVIYSFSGIVAKKASQYKLLSYDFSKWYFIELIIIIVYAYLWQQAIKKCNIVTAYAGKGVVIIWMLIWSVMFFNESIKLNSIIGAAIIIIGIGLVAIDGK